MQYSVVMVDISSLRSIVDFLVTCILEYRRFFPYPSIVTKFVYTQYRFSYALFRCIVQVLCCIYFILKLRKALVPLLFNE